MKEALTAIGTVSCALGIGFVMQSGETARFRYGDSAQNAVPELLAELPSDTAGLPYDDAALAVHGITLTSAEVKPLNLPTSPDMDIPTPDAPMSDLETPVTPEAAIADACPVALTATPLAAAMVRLSLTAPCLKGQRVSVQHQGMTFTEITSEEGRLDLAVPALVKDAVFSLAFASGEQVSVRTKMESLPLYERTVLMWRGNFGFQLHAREFGADYGTPGHVWNGAARDIRAVSGGRGGFLTTYGNPEASEPFMAEVYSFPRVLDPKGDAVDLTIETQVTEENCGLSIDAKVLNLDATSDVVATDLTLAVPGCDSIGNFLVLNNPQQDMKVAAK